MSEEKIQFIINNLAVRGSFETHDILVYKNQEYWFKESNPKSNTTRYVCCQKTKKKCFASITINNIDKSIKRLNDNHTCNTITNEAKIITKVAEQDLKNNVFNNKSKS